MPFNLSQKIFRLRGGIAGGRFFSRIPFSRFIELIREQSFDIGLKKKKIDDLAWFHGRQFSNTIGR